MIPSESGFSDVQKDHQGESEVSSLWDMRFSTSAMVKDHLSFPLWPITFRCSHSISVMISSTRL